MIGKINTKSIPFLFGIYFCCALNAVAINIPGNYEKIVVSIRTSSLKIKHAGTGTGCFYNSGKWIYLITAKHVLEKVLPMPGNLGDGRANVNFYMNEVEENSSEYEIDLSAAIVYPHPDKDIIAVRLARFPGGPPVFAPGVRRISQDGKTLVQVTIDECQKFDDVKIADDAVIAGFPAFVQSSVAKIKDSSIDESKPLFRSGIVAGKNRAKKLIILDTPVLFGNSGGPVFAPDKNKVIGIVTEMQVRLYDLYDSNQNMVQLVADNSSYAIAVPIDFITGLISKLEQTD